VHRPIFAFFVRVGYFIDANEFLHSLSHHAETVIHNSVPATTL